MPKPSAADTEEQLARILESVQFCDSPRLQKFLRFVVSLTLEGNADQIKESTIAFEVFGRADTSDDSIVRSAARRLRARLEDYYEQAGANDPVRIVIPKGHYVPEIGEWPARSQLQELQTSRNLPESVASVPQVRFTVSSSELRSTRHRVNLRGVLLFTTVLAVCFGTGMLWRDRTYAERPSMQTREMYLKGRYYWSKRTPEDLNRAVDLFTQAIVKDPRDAQAYSGLADTYNLLSEFTVMPYREAFRRATAAAQTAVKLDESSAEAHNSLAFASFYGDWDFITAEREFRRALLLNPSDVMAHHWYATFLMSLGREQEAFKEIERAEQLEPSSRAIVADKGLILMYSGQIDSARALLEELAASDPKFLAPHRYLATIYLIEKRYPAYLSQLRTVSLLSEDKSAMSIVQAGEKGFAARGAIGMLERMLRAQEASPTGQNTRYYCLAQTSALLGDSGKGIHYLKLALDEHDVNLVVLAIDPCFTQLRSEPGFREIVRRVGIRQPSPSSAS